MQEHYDIIGDVHGCLDALERLCAGLGYDTHFQHPEGRRLVFVGDLIDRGPSSLGVLSLIADLVRRGRALLTLGNHDDALRRWLHSETIDLSRGGTAQTIREIDARRDKAAFKKTVSALLDNTPLYLVLDGGRLIVAHAGIEEEMIGKTDSETRRFVLNGDAIGRSPEGKPCAGTGRRTTGAAHSLSTATRRRSGRKSGKIPSTSTPALTGAAC